MSENNSLDLIETGHRPASWFVWVLQETGRRREADGMYLDLGEREYPLNYVHYLPDEISLGGFEYLRQEDGT